MNQQITIAELNPQVRGSYLLRFEVAEAAPSSNNPDEVFFKMADETGCINAYFHNHGKHIKNGSVYELTNFKCKVVDHSLRVELIKESKIIRVKNQMSFIDLANNLSDKFYVSKAEQQALTEEKTSTKQEIKTNDIEKSPEEKSKKGKYILKAKEETTPNKKEEVKKEEKKDAIEKQEKTTKQLAEKEQKAKKQTDNQKIEQKLGQGTSKKKKYVERKQEPTTKQSKQLQKQPEIQQRKQRVLLKNIYKYQEKEVNLLAQVHTNTKISFNKYDLIRVCDSSGSAYIQFNKNSHLQNKAWYNLRRFKVYGDKHYGFVASQQNHSQYDMLDQFDQIPDHKPIAFPKPF